MSRSVSVIVPVYHGKEYIEKMIFQVETASQNCKEVETELIFINDAPDDPITMPVESETISVRIFNSEINRGIHGARVWGLSMANGEYVHFLDQDDEISNWYYASQLETIGDGAVVCCRGYEGRREIYDYDRPFESSFVRENILLRPPMVSVGQALIRKSVIPKIWIDNIMKNNGSDDQFLWLSLVSDNIEFILNHNKLFRHTKIGGNFSTDINKLKSSDEEMINILTKKGAFQRGEIELLNRFPQNAYNRRYRYLLKEQQILTVLDSALYCERIDKGISKYLKERGLNRIAIYGASTLGQNISEMIKNRGIEVVYFIDRNYEFIVSGIPIYSIDTIPANQKIDFVLVTVISGKENIIDNLKAHLEVPANDVQTILGECERGFWNWKDTTRS